MSSPEREICTCPHCLHPTARHGCGYVEIEGRDVYVLACLDCPQNACLIRPVLAEKGEIGVHRRQALRRMSAPFEDVKLPEEP